MLIRLAYIWPKSYKSEGLKDPKVRSSDLNIILFNFFIIIIIFLYYINNLYIINLDFFYLYLIFYFN